METHDTCIPCLLKQVDQTARLFGLSDASTEEMVDRFRCFLKASRTTGAPPEMAVFIQDLLVSYTGNTDPYLEIKHHSNNQALAVVEDLRSSVEGSSNPLKTAVALACAGNIIDYGVFSSGIDVHREIGAILGRELDGIGSESSTGRFQFAEFSEALDKAEHLLYVGDNAGEIVFDLILLETIKGLYPNLTIHFATRGKPILNDVLVDDAFMVGIDSVATVVSSGVPTPGLVLSLASEEFLSLYNTCDLIVSKGQGNFESLPLSDPRIFYLFITKCPVVANLVGSSLQELVLVCKRTELN